MITTFGSQNQPLIADTQSPDFSTDYDALSNWAASVGNRKVGTSAQRLALTGADVWPGLSFWETDTHLGWTYKTSGWVLRWGTTTATPAYNSNVTPVAGYAPGLIFVNGVVTLQGVVSFSSRPAYLIGLPAWALPNTYTSPAQFNAGQIVGATSGDIDQLFVNIAAAQLQISNSYSTGSPNASGDVAVNACWVV